MICHHRLFVMWVVGMVRLLCKHTDHGRAILVPWGAVRTIGLFAQSIVRGKADGEIRGSREN